MKEAIFNALGPALAGATVLDLFAGSGALGIEALSRGADHVTFVERDAATTSVIRRNLADLGYEDRADVVRTEVVRWLRTHPGEVAPASVVLLDPPYNDAVLDRALALLDERVQKGATVIVEHAPRRPLPPLQRLQPTRDRRYGDTVVTFLRVPGTA